MHDINFALENASASGPIKGARNTYDKVNENLSSGAHQPE